MLLEVSTGVSEQNTSPINTEDWGMCHPVFILPSHSGDEHLIQMFHHDSLWWKWMSYSVHLICLWAVGFPSEKKALLDFIFCSDAHTLCSWESGSFWNMLTASTDNVLRLGSRTVTWLLDTSSDEHSSPVLLVRWCLEDLIFCYIACGLHYKIIRWPISFYLPVLFFTLISSIFRHEY